MRRRTSRKWQETDDDPTSGLVNLFDIWMVFAVAVLLAFVQAGLPQKAAVHSQESAADLDPKKAKAIKVQVTHEKLTGQGERLGTAYRLQSGEVVYVPEP